ncbi:TRAP transporter small permease [Paracoccus sp. M683]|uniref:TRAP transporter small permease n=1 Tax=Paracoccus sp. M683 TaxID=2594268 RepID=UPI00117C0BA4|nr:TRAP transporter small permease [Paracoccus sp. M683]TRW97605.1 TRAP transporter small permease [Paracoccus sp. M683]
MRAYLAILGWAARLCGWAAMALLVAAVVVVTQMVVIRYVMNGSTIWQTEFVIYSTTAAMLLGSPYVLALRGHVGVDVLVQAASPGWRRVMELIAAIASIIFVGAMTWSGVRFLVEAIHGGWTTDTVWALPLWIPFWPLPVAMGLMLLQLLADIVLALRPDLAPPPMEEV